MGTGVRPQQDPYGSFGQKPKDPYAEFGRPAMTPAEMDALAADQQYMDSPPRQMKPVPRAQADATRILSEPKNPTASKLPEIPVVSPILRHIVNPALEHPLALALTGPLAFTPPGAAVVGAGMAGRVSDYGFQKAAEQSLPDDVRKMAEHDPTRISGEEAAVDAGMLAVGPLIHGATKGLKAGLPKIAHGEIPAGDAHTPIRNALANMTPKEIQNALDDPHLGPMTRKALGDMPAPVVNRSRPSGPDIRGDVFGLPDEGTAVIRDRAHEFAKGNLVNTTVRNAPTGWDVTITQNAINHATFAGNPGDWHAGVSSLSKLPELIRDGQYHSTEATRGSLLKRRDVPLHHTLRAPFTVDGRPYVAELTLREYIAEPANDKKLFHVNAIKIEPADPASSGLPPSTTGASAAEPTGSEHKIAPEDLAGEGERFSGPGIPTKVRDAIRTAYRSALVTPNAEIEGQAPALADALNKSGASSKRAQHISERRMGRVFEGLTDEQKSDFGTKLVHDNIVAEAERKGAAADAIGRGEAGEPAEPTKSKRGLWYSSATANGDLRPPVEMETGPLLDEMHRRADLSLKYHKDMRKYGPSSVVTIRNEQRLAEIETLLEERDGLDRDTVWGEVDRRRKAKLAEQDDDFNFGANVKPGTKEPAPALEFDRHEPDPTPADDPAAPLREAAARFRAHAEAMAPRVRQGIEAEPWFQKALATYKTEVEAPLTADAIASGVSPESLRQPKSAYVRLASEARMDDSEIRRALDESGKTDPADLQRRPKLVRALIGENPTLKRYYASQADGARQGPLAKDAGYPGEPQPARGNKVAVSGSAKMATGSAQHYVTDLNRVVEFDARDKATKAGRNAVFQRVAEAGRRLEEGEAPAFGKKVLAFNDAKGLVDANAGTLRYEVSPEIHTRVTEALSPKPEPSAGRRGLQTIANVATRAQIAGMPVEATSHANTLSSIVGAVPGEKGPLNHIIAAIPGVGGKAAAIREMLRVDFAKPEIRALENRLADVGALRIETERGGALNAAHHWLFGPEGVDVRGRLVLARKYLKANPKATDAELAEFVNGKLGNYISENAGALPNFMAKGSVLSPFARFQSARIPTAVKTTLGQSGLPTKSKAGKVADVAKTLYRGPVGHVTGAMVLSKLLAGQQNDEPGHALDVGTGLYAVPGGIKRMTAKEAEAKYGDKASPIYIPAATLNPVAYTGLRATGLRSLIPKLSPDAPATSRVANAVRDQANVALGTAGPLMRFIQGAITGTQPYLQSDNTLLRTAPRRFGAGTELRDQVVSALEGANPALHAFAGNGGEGSRTLASALTEDGKPLGGPASIAARVAEFTLPRIMNVGVGGRTNEQSAENQLDRRYREAMVNYTQRIKRAAGPKMVAAIIREAAEDADRNGYNPDTVVAALEKAAEADHSAVADKANNARNKRLTKTRKP